METMEFHRKAFNSVGWFIPPYVQMGFLGQLAKQIEDKRLNDGNLELILGQLYSADYLSSMICERYPIVPCINDYKEIIAETIESHFLGLDHVAVAGLMPVIEGAGRKLAESRSVTVSSIKSVFQNLAADCKNDVIANNIGAVGEIISMMDSFIDFTDNNLYINANSYGFDDKTNRHGILHGAYSDEDYGTPINFYKSIAAVDFLCFVSALRAPISCFAPKPTEHSLMLGNYYQICKQVSNIKPKATNKSLENRRA